MHYPPQSFILVSDQSSMPGVPCSSVLPGQDTARPRLAMSLPEVLMAAALLVVAVSLSMQGLISAVSGNAYGSAQDEVSFDANHISDVISTDLSLSGWDSTRTLGVRAQLSNALAGDRNEYYFPYVSQQVATTSTRGVGTQFPHAARPAARVDLTLPAGLPGLASDATKDFNQALPTDRAAYLASFYAKSQELIFLRQASMDPTQGLISRNTIAEQFVSGQDWTLPNNRAALNVLYLSAWEEFPLGSGLFRVRPALDANADGIPDAPYGLPITSGELQSTDGELSLLPRWETITPPDNDPTTQDNWREYMYCVVPSPVGFGRLVLARKVAVTTASVAGVNIGQIISTLPSSNGFGMEVLEILSDNVVRVVFDTFRTDSTLDVNQIRMRVYFARQSTVNPTVVVSQVKEMLFTMRTKNSYSDVGTDLGLISPSVGFDF